MRIVLDTNVLLVCLSPRSESHWLWQVLLPDAFDLYVTTDVLNEYAEIIGREMGQVVSDLALDLMTDLPNIHLNYHWQLIEAGPDDNKFVDCAIAAGAHYLVSEDRHFRVIRQFPYLNIELLTLSEFRQRLA